MQYFVLLLLHNVDLNDSGKEALECIVGKGENAGKQHFLLFPQHFLPDQINIALFVVVKCFCLYNIHF